MRSHTISTCKVSGGTSILTPAGNVYLCPGELVMFTCGVTQSQMRLLWRITFEDVSVSSVEKIYLSSDSVGKIETDERDGIQIIFNLTISNVNSLLLESTMTVNASQSLMNGTEIHCTSRLSIDLNATPNAVIHIKGKQL